MVDGRGEDVGCDVCERKTAAVGSKKRVDCWDEAIIYIAGGVLSEDQA